MVHCFQAAICFEIYEIAQLCHSQIVFMLIDKWALLLSTNSLKLLLVNAVPLSNSISLGWPLSRKVKSRHLFTVTECSCRRNPHIANRPKIDQGQVMSALILSDVYSQPLPYFCWFYFSFLPNWHRVNG